MPLSRKLNVASQLKIQETRKVSAVNIALLSAIMLISLGFLGGIVVYPTIFIRLLACSIVFMSVPVVATRLGQQQET
ncbi:hypothetical protein [Pedobacter sp. SYP-B3415]|uniref:hypothetical protein n=1 Tax=Pedobacter sp. SYP-B3415 TaxID=2496641 RepID=UPI00101BA093|nr:hypothetical protein [Pedobacter sp. SYP-B3415]